MTIWQWLTGLTLQFTGMVIMLAMFGAEHHHKRNVLGLLVILQALFPMVCYILGKVI